ncbi:MAG: DUF6776 family protein [Betaproteobacteria bacterium]|jgi:hypothetical protein
MKWNLFRRKLTVSAPRVIVRGRLPGPVRALLGFVFLAGAAAAGVATYEYGRQFGGPDRRELQAEVERLSSQVRELTADRDRFAALATAYEAQLKVETVACETLGQQVSSLESESTRLREDLAFFESLLPAPAGKKGLLIRSFRLQPEGAPHEMRYKLLVQQSGKPERDFVGTVQMQINFAQGGRSWVLNVPDPNSPQSLAVAFRHYQRLEGTFALPEGAVARSVVVKVLANGETQAQQTFAL